MKILRSVSSSTSTTGAPMIRASDVLLRLVRVLDGTLPISQLNVWLAGEAWDMHLDSDAETVDLVNGVQLAVAEYTSGHLTRPQLMARFAQALQNLTVRFDEAPSFCVDSTQSPSNTIFSRWPDPMVVYGPHTNSLGLGSTFAVMPRTASSQPANRQTTRLECQLA